MAAPGTIQDLQCCRSYCIVGSFGQSGVSLAPGNGIEKRLDRRVQGLNLDMQTLSLNSTS